MTGFYFVHRKEGKVRKNVGVYKNLFYKPFITDNCTYLYTSYIFFIQRSTAIFTKRPLNKTHFLHFIQRLISFRLKMKRYLAHTAPPAFCIPSAGVYTPQRTKPPAAVIFRRLTNEQEWFLRTNRSIFCSQRFSGC